jgi:hypothetical protein
MIKVNLVLAEYMAKGVENVNPEKLEAARFIKELLSQIDFAAEVVPENNAERFGRLLTSLKGGPLNKYESALVEEIANY